IDFSQVVTARSLEEIIVLLDETDYKLPLIKARLRFQETGSLFFLEASLDLDYYRRLVEATRHLSSMDRQIARVLIGLEIDQENINWLVRQRLYYSLGLEQFLEWVIPGGCHISQESIRASYVADGHQHIMEALARGPYQALKKFSGEDFHLMERFLHEVLLHQVKKTLAGFPFTIGTLLGYLILKKRETKLLLSLCYGKAAGLSQPDIERLIVP
ncbi:MAG TPA: V-type ATPase subunit, partial [bacterium]|nr:V-type ATPase subunit [bacterium]